MSRVLEAVYCRPYVVIFAAAVVLSAHGLYAAAVHLGRIPAWLAWAYVLIVDLLAVAAYRTWRTAAESGRQHWAAVVAALAAAGTVTLNTVAAYPELAAVWVGPAIAGFPPIAALLATALRMAEQRLQLVVDISVQEPAGQAEPAVASEPVTQPVVRPSAASPQPGRRLTALPAVTPDIAGIVAGIVAGHVRAGGRVTDPALTAIVAEELGCSDRTARRRLQPFREETAA